MKKALLISSAVALVATKCSSDCDSGGCESAMDSVPDEGCMHNLSFVAQLRTITYNCDEAGWWYDLQVVGLTSAAELYIHQSGSDNPWTEYGHGFPPTEPFSSGADSDTRGYYDDIESCWDNPYLELAHVRDFNEVVLGQSTLFDCTAARDATLTWSVVVYDYHGAFADCGSWGHDPSGAYAGYDFGACELL